MEWGNGISHSGVSLFPSQSHADVVAHSPTPSMHTTAFRMATEEGRCGMRLMMLGKQNLREELLGISGAWIRNSFWSNDLSNSFSFNQTGMAARNDCTPRGAKARYVSNNRSNFTSGLS